MRISVAFMLVLRLPSPVSASLRLSAASQSFASKPRLAVELLAEEDLLDFVRAIVRQDLIRNSSDEKRKGSLRFSVIGSLLFAKCGEGSLAEGDLKN